MNANNYLYRRQYVIGPQKINLDGLWNYDEFGDSAYIAYQKDLPLSKGYEGDNFVVVLGYMIDPYNPDADTAAIVTRIVKGCDGRPQTLLRLLASICGRYVVLSRLSGKSLVVSDATRLRQAFYYRDANGEIWLSSQPHLIAQQLDLPVSQDILNDLRRCHLFFRSSEYWYPGRITLYAGIYHLQPNHYLDLNSARVVRFWPSETWPIPKQSIRMCIQKVSLLLTGIMAAATKHYQVAFGLSSGLDSRVLLAASRPVSKEIKYFSLTSQNKGHIEADARIPGQMLSALGLSHNYVERLPSMNDGFRRVFEKNVFTARRVKGLNAYSIMKHFGLREKELMIVNGNLGEITRRERKRFPQVPLWAIRGDSVTAMVKMTGSEHALREFTEWVDAVKPLTRQNAYPLDLCYWEYRVGNWAAMTFSEYDIAFESLCPYNCREYLENMLSVDFSQRTAPEYKLHVEIIKNLWPELLNFEINPPARPMREKLLNLLYRTGAFDLLKYIYLMGYQRFYKES